MTDKERILLAIVTRIIPKLMHGIHIDDEECCESYTFKESELCKGDLVFANTTIRINEFIVGFVERVEKDCVVIRELGGDRLCNYYNESFTKINKKKLGYEYLEGTQYKTYQKVLKAFQYLSDWTRFKSISFDGKICTVQAREKLENDLYFEVSFPYNSKTSIKSIVVILEKAEEEKKRERNDGKNSNT